MIFETQLSTFESTYGTISFLDSWKSFSELPISQLSNFQHLTSNKERASLQLEQILLKLNTRIGIYVDKAKNQVQPFHNAIK